MTVDCVDEKPWSADDATSNADAEGDDHDNNDDDDDDDDGTAAESEYTERRHDDADEAFDDYVRVQLPMQVHPGDNLAKSQLTVNQVHN